MSRHIFDENFPLSIMQIIRRKVASVVQVGQDWGECGWLDVEEILPHLHGSRATFHTLDAGFFKRRYIHESYGIVYYDVAEAELANWIIRFLRHRDFKIHAQRLGRVIKVSPSQLVYWESHQSRTHKTDW